MELYKTVADEGIAEQIIEKSRFITHVKPITTRAEGENFLSEIRREYKDATHNVPAMVLGDKMQTQWASDDGEPQGTSGAPIVQMLVKEGLTNLIVVVTRYFGGVKLGTGGLVRAYTGSAKLGIEAAGVCGVWELCLFELVVDYSYLSKIKSLASSGFSEMTCNEDAECSKEFVIGDIQYTDKVKLIIKTLPENLNNVEHMIANITAGTGTIGKYETSHEKIQKIS